MSPHRSSESGAGSACTGDGEMSEIAQIDHSFSGVGVCADSMRVLCLTELWSSERRRVGDAWAHEGEEGRGKLRKARGSRTQTVIPRWPNGATRRGVSLVITLG